MASPASPLRILADTNIPFVEEAFGRYGAVQTRPGHLLRGDEVAAADVLLVRSVTPVGEALLRGSPVAFVGSATAGIDHVDLGWLADHDVAFAAAPGSNASSVVEYVLAALLALAAERGVGLRGKTLGVVGVGAVGGRLLPRAEALGLRVLACDPPLADAAEARGEPHPFIPLADLLAASDVVSLHTPLTRSGPHPTHHLIGMRALERMRPGAWLVNAARGGVVDGAALGAALAEQRIGAAVLDVWEGEPSPDPFLARRTACATPHIAGYGFDGKVAGTTMLEAAFRAWYSNWGGTLPEPWDAEAVLAADLAAHVPDLPVATPADEARWLDALARQAYDLCADDARFRAHVVEAPSGERADAFRRLRRDYPVRRAWERHRVEGGVPGSLRRAVTEGLGMRPTPQWP